MTVSSSTNRIQYTANGVTVDFAFPYIMFAASDLLVTLYDTTAEAEVSPAPVLDGAATYDYTFAGTFDADKGEYTAGGTITFNTAPPSNYRVTIERVVPPTQAVTLIDNSKFPANTVNGALDRLTVLVQRAMQLLGQALTFPSSDPSSVTNTLPGYQERASKYLAFDSNGNPIASSAPISGGTTPISAFWETTIQIASAALSRVALVVPGLGDNNTYTGTNTFNGAVTFGAGMSLVERIQTFTATGTYTPHAKMVYCRIECVGGGGAGGGTATAGASTGSPAAGGGAGSYSLKIATAADIGASKAVTIGAAGAVGAAGFTIGGSGGDTSVGSLCIGKGGTGGGANNGSSQATGGAGGIAGTGDVTATGESGVSAAAIPSSTGISGAGGSSRFGGGGRGVFSATSSAGEAGTGFGSGGSGGQSFNAGGAVAGGAGTAGYVVVTEFCAA